MLAEVIVEDLTSVGLGTRAVGYLTSELATELGGGDHDLFLIGAVAQTTSSEAYLLDLLGSDSPANVTGYESEEIDSLATGTDPVEAQREALDDLPLVPLVQLNHSLLVSDRVPQLSLRLDGTFTTDGLFLQASSFR